MVNYLGFIMYIFLISGLLVIIKPGIKRLYVSKRIDSKVDKIYGVRTKKLAKRNDDKLINYLSKLINATLGLKGETYVLYFILVSILLATFGIILTLKVLPFALGMFVTFGLMSLPFIILSVKLQNSRVFASREGDLLITELLNNYKICYYNMEEAISKTAIELNDAPYSKKILFNLAKGLAVKATAEEIQELLDVFKYSISTTWGNILATNIYFATTSGMKVTNSLQDLSDSIIKARKVMEYGKRENNESVLMLKYLAPVCYILTYIGAVKFFGFTISKFINYQFGTNTGLTWFIIIITVYTVGIIVSSFLTKTKMEL
ncbi:MAG: hypothetical protein RR495_03810 [Anaerovoracaceae bacterium]